MLPFFQKKPPQIHAPAVLDQIEAAVYAHLKPLGFRKHGRTLHRLVSGDISQVVNFQYHYYSFCVNVGIRVPECEERTFTPPINGKKYYHEYNCNIRSRLGTVSGHRETWYDLTKDPEKLAAHICRELDAYVLPAFEALHSRDQILNQRRNYPRLDNMLNHLIALDEAFIYGCRGDMETAAARFDAYYQQALEVYRKQCTEGHRIWLHRGETVQYKDAHGAVQTVTAKFPHYVRTYNANRQHLAYLDELAVKLGIRQSDL